MTIESIPYMTIELRVVWLLMQISLNVFIWLVKSTFLDAAKWFIFGTMVVFGVDNKRFGLRYDLAKVEIKKTRRPIGPGSLTRVLVTRRGCLPQNINSISPTPKSILGIT